MNRIEINRRLKAFSLYAVFMAGILPAAFTQQISKTGANDPVTGATTYSDEVSVWAVPAEHKVRPKDRIQSENLVWSQKDRKVSIAGAGNEHAPFQVVITVPSPSGRKPKAPDGFFVSASNLTSKEGKVIPKEQVSFYLEHYILLTGVSSPVGATGLWPDALAPIKEPFSMAAQYEVVQNRPIWVDIDIPAATPAGTYTGTISVTRDGKTVENLKIELRVYGFSLPEKTSLISYINVSKSWLAGFYHKSPDSPEMDRLTQRYYEFLYEHRMEPWFNDQLQPEITLKGTEIQVKFNDERYKYFLNRLKTNRVLLNAYPSGIRKYITEAPFSDGFNKKIKSYLRQVATYFIKNGWKEHLVLNSPIDEPNTEEEYINTRRWATLAHEAAPGVPFLATESPVPDDPAWGTLTGKVNNFSIHGNALNRADVKKAIREEQAKGGEMTWYISCDQKYPQPNYFIDAPALDLVMVPWITEAYSMNGILYWATNYWPQTPNPWISANTYISGFLCSGGYILNGEGSLLYPGDYVKTYTGQPNVDGPVSSIRFELLREGIEDYDYLRMLKKAGEEGFADEMVKNLVIDVSAFSRNTEALYTIRKTMAERLEQLAKQK